jgi:hypothetical protein
MKNTGKTGKPGKPPQENAIVMEESVQAQIRGISQRRGLVFVTRAILQIHLPTSYLLNYSA